MKICKKFVVLKVKEIIKIPYSLFGAEVRHLKGTDARYDRGQKQGFVHILLYIQILQTNDERIGSSSIMSMQLFSGAGPGVPDPRTLLIQLSHK